MCRYDIDCPNRDGTVRAATPDATRPVGREEKGRGTTPYEGHRAAPGASVARPEPPGARHAARPARRGPPAPLPRREDHRRGDSRGERGEARDVPGGPLLDSAGPPAPHRRGDEQAGARTRNGRTCLTARAPHQ